MSFLKRIFNSDRSRANSSTHSHPASQYSLPASSQHSQSPAAQQGASRRELLRLVLRDTLNRTGIPTSWISADLLAATSRGREPGIHVRLLLKHWDPRLMLHGIAFQNSFYKRLLTLDPLADRWLLGVSWQYALADDSNCPQMPHPGIWTSSVPTDLLVAAASAAEAVDTAEPVDLLGGSIVISGPARTPDSFVARPVATNANSSARQAPQRPQQSQQSQPHNERVEAKADLERLFAIRDADLKRHSETNPSSTHFAATEPATLESPPDEPRYLAGSGTAPQAFSKTDIFKRPAWPTPPAADKSGKTLTSN
jgi:hypothetical protein